MKVIFICYNYFTLYKAIYTANNKYSAYDSTIIYRNTISKIPKVKEFNGKIIEVNPIRRILNRKNKYFNFISEVILTKKINKVMKNELHTYSKAILVVFKDQLLLESTIVSEFKRLGNISKKVELLEEGLGLYEKKIDSLNKNSIGNSIFENIGISNYFLRKNPQGYNPLIDEIICGDPKKLKKLKSRKNLQITQQPNMFSEENSMFFMTNILGFPKNLIEKYKRFNYIFLTQSTLENINQVEEELKIIKEIKRVFKEEILVKKHPRDNSEFSFSTIPGVTEVPKEFQIIPFECFCAVINEPIIITYYSSAYKNILQENDKAKVILLYKLLNDQRINKLMNDLEEDNNPRIMIPNSIEELKVLLGKN